MARFPKVLGITLPSLVLLSGCFSTYSVQKAELKTAIESGKNERHVMNTNRFNRTTLAPLSQIRLMDNTGHCTKTLTARKLLIDKKGVYWPVRKKLNQCQRAIATGFGRSLREALIATKPADGRLDFMKALEKAPQKAELRAKNIGAWLDAAFAHAQLNRLTPRESPSALLLHENSNRRRLTFVLGRIGSLSHCDRSYSKYCRKYFGDRYEKAAAIALKDQLCAACDEAPSVTVGGAGRNRPPLQVGEQPWRTVNGLPWGICANQCKISKGRLAAWVTSPFANSEMGDWEFHFSGGATAKVAAAKLKEIRREGIIVHQGWPWSKIARAEVSNLSGGKSFGALIGTAAVAALLAPVAFIARGVPNLSAFGKSGKGGGMPTVPLGGGSPDSPNSTCRNREVVETTAALSSSSPSQMAKTMAKAAKSAESKDARNAVYSLTAKRIFTPTQRRRALVSFTAALGTGTDFRNGDQVQTDVQIGVRFLRTIELGAGARNIVSGTATRDDKVSSNFVGFFHFGLNFELDAAQRVSIPIGFDVGKGGPVELHAKTLLGLRVRVHDRIHLGVYPFNPTYSRFENSHSYAQKSRWSFPTSLELSTNF
jgi:hypothetical protein